MSSIYEVIRQYSFCREILFEKYDNSYLSIYFLCYYLADSKI